MLTLIQSLSLLSSSFMLVLALTPLMRVIALQVNFMDQPKASHKSHTEPVPYLGGVAIIFGVLSVIYTAVVTQENLQGKFWLANSLFVPALILGVVGLIDDRKMLDPLPRFIIQTAAGVCTAALLILSDTVGNPTGNVALDAAITVLWMVGISNSINFLDNLDGGAAGVLAIISLSLFVITQLNGQFLIAATSITLTGAMLGFLIWNRNPAKIFMGDAGALFLGIVVGAVTLRLNPEVDSRTVSFAIPILLLAIPLLDTSVALTSRIRRRKSIFEGGRDHLSHRLLRQGFNKTHTALILWALTATFSGISIVILTVKSSEILLLLIAGILWLVLFLMFMKSSDE